MSWSVKWSWHEPVGDFSKKKDAERYAKQMRAANRQAGNVGAVRVVKSGTPKKNSGRKAASKRNPSVKAISLRNFTGKVRLNPDKTVSVLGVGRKKKAAKKTAVRKRTRKTARRKR